MSWFQKKSRYEASSETLDGREVEFDIEGLNVYAIEYKSNTGKTIFAYKVEGREDDEYVMECTVAQHNAFVARLRRKLKLEAQKKGA